MIYRVTKRQNNSRDCFICGVQNDAGVKIEYYECIDPDGKNVLVGVINPKEFHQSYPDRMHGGVISALLDETIGRAVQIEHPEIWGVTVELSVRFRKPTPLSGELYVICWTTNIESRTFGGEGQLVDKSGVVLATATAKYFRVPDPGLDTENWFLVDKELPAEIIIGD